MSRIALFEIAAFRGDQAPEEDSEERLGVLLERPGRERRGFVEIAFFGPDREVDVVPGDQPPRGQQQRVFSDEGQARCPPASGRDPATPA